MYRKPRTCVNPRCNDDCRYLLCPSCALLGRWAFGLGAVLAGLLVKLFAK